MIFLHFSRRNFLERLDVNEGLILDRAMQLNLDRSFWALGYDFVGTIQSEKYDNLNLGFVESDLIVEWSNWVCRCV